MNNHTENRKYRILGNEDNIWEGDELYLEGSETWQKIQKGSVFINRRPCDYKTPIIVRSPIN